MKARNALWALLAAATLSLTLGSPAHAAKPVTVLCGEVITEDTKLANDLTDCPDHGIEIGADGVTLDLNGHTIDGDGVEPDLCRVEVDCPSGVDNAAGHDAVTITGGSVREFASGVLVVDASKNRVHDLQVSENYAHGIFLSRTTDSTFAKNSLFDNFSGLAVVKSSDVAVADNSITGSELGGIPVFDSQGVRIAGNSVSDNQGEGIVLLDHSRENTVVRNSLSDNGDGIVVAEGSERNLVRGNSASGGGVGVVIVDSDRNVVQENALREASFAGIVVEGSDANHLERNSIVGNGPEPDEVGGIYLVANFEDPSDASDRNVIQANDLVDNDGDGILVEAGQTENVIERNRATENSNDGIDVDTPSTTLAGNTANQNGDLGIEAVDGVTDGGGNKASGNGNALQCTNVFCR